MRIGRILRPPEKRGVGNYEHIGQLSFDAGREVGKNSIIDDLGGADAKARSLPSIGHEDDAVDALAAKEVPSAAERRSGRPQSWPLGTDKSPADFFEIGQRIP